MEERLWGNEEQGEEGRGKAGEHSCCLFLEHLLGARHCAKSMTRAITPAGLSTHPLGCDPKRPSNCPTSHAQGGGRARTEIQASQLNQDSFHPELSIHCCFYKKITHPHSEEG